MATRVYASFKDSERAERAAGALLDHEMNPDDLSIVCGNISKEDWENYEECVNAEDSVKGGITTTTGADAGSGALKGLAWGAVIGAIAGLGLVLWIPGLGLVIGGGALATALGGVAGTAGGGAIAGAITGYLKDQGVAPEKAQEFADHLEAGGAVIELHVPSGKLDLPTAESVLAKYEADQVVVEA